MGIRSSSFVSCFGVVVAAAAAISCAGCGQASSVGKVHGTVTLDGQPLKSGSIVTLPSAGRGARGLIKDGKFELGTEGDNDGAVIGVHKVAVIAREPSQGTGPEAAPGKLLVPEKYTSPTTSELSIDVKAGDNTPTLELKSQ
jgi:hypothetical protein